MPDVRGIWPELIMLLPVGGVFPVEVTFGLNVRAVINPDVRRRSAGKIL